MANRPLTVKFAVCDEVCRLGNLEISNWVVAHQAVESLSSVYPVDANGNLEVLNDDQLETIRQTEITEWREVEDGEEVAVFLEEVPEIVVANYACDRRRQLGKCAFRPTIQH